jgi:flagellar biosynthetic protein FliP
MTSDHDFWHLAGAPGRRTMVVMILTRANLRFALHFAEMIVAMFVGMFALAPVWELAVPGLPERADVQALVMATDMAVGMAAWMAIRRHSWPRILEMSAVMYVPFAVMLVPFWLDWVSGHAVMMAGHVLMGPLMLAAMLWRRAEYSHIHDHR